VRVPIAAAAAKRVRITKKKSLFTILRAREFILNINFVPLFQYWKTLLLLLLIHR